MLESDLACADRLADRNVMVGFLGVGNPPIVANIHASGFMRGDELKPDGLDMVMRAGIAVASINCPLPDQATWPGQYGGLLDADMAAVAMTSVTGAAEDAGLAKSRLIGAAVGKNPDLAIAVSPIAFLAALPPDADLPPFLIMHGEKDTTISRIQSGRLFMARLSRPAPRNYSINCLRGLVMGRAPSSVWTRKSGALRHLLSQMTFCPGPSLAISSGLGSSRPVQHGR